MSLLKKILLILINVSVIRITYASLLSTEHNSMQNTVSDGPLGLSVKCFWFDSKTFAVFDLNYLKKGNSQAKYNLTELLPNNPDIQNDTILFNLCGNVKSCDDEITGKEGYAQFLYEYINEENKLVCRRYGGNIQNGNSWELINPNNFSEGVIMKLTKGTENYSMSLKMYCSKGIKFEVIEAESNFQKDSLTNSLSIRSQYACPETQMYSVWKFIVGKKEIFASIMIIIGVLLMFLGFKFVEVSIFIVTCGTTIVVMIIFIYQYIIPSGTIDSVIWLVLAMSTVGGLFASYFALKFKENVFGIVLGIAVGIVVGQVIFNAIADFLTKYPSLIQAALYITFIVIFTIIGKFAFKHLVIIGTSMIGTYLVVRGVSIFLGGFPNETTIIDLISNGETEQLEELLSPIVYAYLGVWVVASVASTIAQYKINKEEMEEINEETLSGKEKAKRKFFLGGLGLDKV